MTMGVLRNPVTHLSILGLIYKQCTYQKLKFVLHSTLNLALFSWTAGMHFIIQILCFGI